MTTSSRSDHDALYHRLFSLPGVVAELIREFIGGADAAGIDLADLRLDELTRLNAKFHANTGQRREGDMVWRIPRRDGADTYLVLMLEFQSTSDQYMALRVLTYAGLLWQQLVSEQRIFSNGKLPPLLPVVVYNGDTRWRAPVAVRDLVGLPEASPLWRWQPELRYHLIDVGAFSHADLASRDGLPALWFRLESASNPGQVVAIADAVLRFLARHPELAEAKAVFAEFLGGVLAPLRPDVRVPEDLLEVRNMLASRAEQWKQEWRKEGLEEGLREGIQEGRQEGIQQGLQEGLQQGLQQGLQMGRRDGRRDGEAAMLLRLLARRFGAPPEWALDRVRAADVADLEAWGMRVLDARTLDDVFGGRSPGG